MFQFIRKHQAIGLIFIGIVIVSFVIFFSPNQGGGAVGAPGGPVGVINGEPVGRDEYFQALKEVRLSRLLRDAGGNRDRSQEDREIADRLFLLREARSLGIRVPDEVAAARILEMGFLKDEKTGVFDRSRYDQFLAGLAQDPGVSRADFEQFMRHEVALQHLVQLGGMSGSLVPPREAASRYREINTRFDLQVVTFSSTSHLAQVDLSQEKVAGFYSNRMAEYRVPERMQVRYVKFALTNYLAEAETQLAANTNVARALDEEYANRGPDTFLDAEGKVMTPEAAKALIREQYKLEFARPLARKAANEFANRLYQMEANAESLTKLATASGLAAQASAPFDSFRPPLDMQVPTTFNRAAFALSADEPFATPVAGEDGVYVFAFERRIPSQIPPLEEVQARVVDSLRRTESRAMAENAGRQFATAVSNALAQSKSLADAAGEAGLKVLTLTNVSRSTVSLPDLPPRLTVSELLRVSEELRPGGASGFVPSGDGGFVLQVQARNPVPEEDLQRELPEFIKQSRLAGRYGAFSEWERQRFAASSVQLPGLTPSTNAPAAY